MEELKKAIIYKVNQIQNERWLEIVYYCVRRLLLQEKGGEDHGDGGQEDLPAAL